jgi:L-ascorbate metabolism protein UlaG (beta-lactamase superfamily)
LAAFAWHCYNGGTMKTITCAVCFAAAAVCLNAQRPVQEFQTNKGVVKITPIRHASMLIQAGVRNIYIDPAQGSLEGLPSADIILITDIHGDHMAPPMIAKLENKKTLIIGPKAVAATVTNIEVMNNGESKTVGDWTIDAVPMYNIQRKSPDGKLYHDKGRGNGYVLTYDGMRFYISGDTEGIPEMRALKNIDVAFVCMNLPYTMTPEEAADAVKEFHPKIVYPYHYGKSDLQVFKKALEGTGIDVRLVDWYY